LKTIEGYLGNAQGEKSVEEKIYPTTSKSSESTDSPKSLGVRLTFHNWSGLGESAADA
jgi:hypothetical protein